jgi:hypothetical protein
MPQQTKGIPLKYLPKPTSRWDEDVRTAASKADSIGPAPIVDGLLSYEFLKNKNASEESKQAAVNQWVNSAAGQMEFGGINPIKKSIVPAVNKTKQLAKTAQKYKLGQSGIGVIDSSGEVLFKDLAGDPAYKYDHYKLFGDSYRGERFRYHDGVIDWLEPPTPNAYWAADNEIAKRAWEIKGHQAFSTGRNVKPPNFDEY